ncbi:unnamed protein product [Rotaria socialis]|uniref:F-box domain-containing protein n=1 Tax=Rotaria socialis TaxID=392032 RepID=A0A817PZZ4_9BILA|nr:unnamed protein product [Rotaria socialis]CAF4355205.1 unnamed protein product [Rotaria socialis]
MMIHSLVQLDDLPDEVLMIILKKLDSYEVLYSLISVNKRLNTLVHDSIFTSHLTLMKRLANDSISPLSERILHRFYSQILPEIHYKIQWLNIESSSMERILSENYPNLHGLGLYNLEMETTTHLFANGNIFTDLMKNQILSLIICIRKNRKQTSATDENTIMFTNLFTMFTNLQYLNFNSSSIDPQYISFEILSPIFISSTLLELHVSVASFGDCLYLLDGRFDQLRAFYVNISWIPCSSRLRSNNMGNLPDLKCFSLHSSTDTLAYDELIVPLLHRMFNLEKLDLYLAICCKNALIDGNNLKKNIINHMPKLNKFKFNIRSTVRLDNQINLLSNEDIQYTFNDFPNNQIISCVDYFSEIKQSQCHIYSYPYEWKEYHQITNSFPGGISNNVREISLFDEQPFEHYFFSNFEINSMHEKINFN